MGVGRSTAMKTNFQAPINAYSDILTTLSSITWQTGPQSQEVCNELLALQLALR